MRKPVSSYLLTLAGVGARTGVGLGGGAATLTGAGVVAALALTLAGVQAAAGMGVSLGRGLLVVGGQQLATQHGTGDDATESGGGQLAEVSPADVFIQLLHFAVSSEMRFGPEPGRGAHGERRVILLPGALQGRIPDQPWASVTPRVYS